MTAQPGHWLSVVTPSYDYARFLPTCLASVQEQAGATAVQHIVVDDGSHDDSWDVICAHHPRPDRDCARQANRGLSATLNRAVSMADGQWLNWLNADDFLLSGAASAVERAWRAVPSADVIFGDAVEVDEAGRLLRLVSQPAYSRSLFERGYNAFAVPAVFVRRERLLEHAFDESMSLLMDLDMWLAVTAAPATVVKLDTALAAVRRHAGQISAVRRDSDVKEMRAIGRRHHIGRLERATSARAPLTSKVHHAALKAADGGWVRELKWRSRRGTGMDWTSAAASHEPDAGPTLRMRVRTVGDAS